MVLAAQAKEVLHVLAVPLTTNIAALLVTAGRLELIADLDGKSEIPL